MEKIKDAALPWRQRIGYGVSDFACNLAFQLVSVYLLYFYTDVFGLGVAAAGTLFLVARVVDAVDGPIWGILIDRTNTRWGKSRPYFLWFMIPFAVFIVLVFTVPDLSTFGKLVWAYITYIGVDVLYSAVNIPVYSILPSMTTDTNERVKLSVIRTLFGTVGTTIITVSALPLVNGMGNGDQAKGFFFLALAIAVIFVMVYIFVFLNVKENVKTPESNQSLPLKQSVKALYKNWPWLIVILINLVNWIGMQTRSQVTVYFFKYNLNNPGLASVILGIGGISLITVVMTPMLVPKIGKRNTVLSGTIMAIIGQVILYFGAGSLSVPVIIAGSVVGYLGSGLTTGLMSVMLADAVDYGEWKNGVRAEGIVTSFSSFSAKLGMGLGGALTGAVLSMGGYVPNAVQSAESLTAIEMNFIWIPLIGSALCAVFLLFYKVDRFEDKMHKELEAKHLTHGSLETEG